MMKLSPSLPQFRDGQKNDLLNGCQINDQVQRDVNKGKVLVRQRKLLLWLKNPLS